MSKMIIECQEEFSTVVRSSLGEVELVTDASKEYGGRGKHFSPTDLFAASLGSCILTIMGMHAKKLGVDFSGVAAHVLKIPSATGGAVAEIIVEVYYPRALEDSLKEKLEKAAKNCPIHHSIDPKIKQQIIFYYEKTITQDK